MRDRRYYFRKAWEAGFRLQAWHLNDGATNSADGRWDTLPQSADTPPKLECPEHLYRIHPDDEHRAAGYMLKSAVDELERTVNSEMRDMQTRVEEPTAKFLA